MQLEAQELLDLRHAEAASLESDVEQESPDEPSPPAPQQQQRRGGRGESACTSMERRDSAMCDVPPFEAPNRQAAWSAARSNRRSPSCSCSSLPASLQQWADYTNDYAQQRGAERELADDSCRAVCLPGRAYLHGHLPSAAVAHVLESASTSSPSSPLSSLAGASSSSSATSMSHHRHLLLLPLTRCPACALSSSRCSTPSLATTCLRAVSHSTKPWWHSRVARPSSSTSPRSHTSGATRSTAWPATTTAALRGVSGKGGASVCALAPPTTRSCG